MKNYTPPLVHTGKAPFTLKRLFLGSSGAKNFYYRARHKEDDIFIMWIEAERFGKTYAFPCVLEEEGDPMIYQPGKGVETRQENTRMVQRWGLLITPDSFSREFDVEELAPEDFHREYGEYKARDYEDPAQVLERERQTAAALAEGEPSPDAGEDEPEDDEDEKEDGE